MRRLGATLRGVAVRRPGRLVGLPAVLLTLVATALLPQAFAGYTAATNDGANSWQASVLQPPSNLTVTQTCSAGTPSAHLSWTPTGSTWATGYHLTRVGGPTQTVTPTGTTTWTDATIANSTGYTWQLSTYSGNWTSTTVSASLTTSCPTVLGAPSITSGPVGSSVTVSGSGFRASAPLSVTFGTVTAVVTGGATSSATGTVSTTFTVPFSGNGSYPITVSDGTDTATSATSFTVTGSFDGVAYTGITKSKGTETCSTATITQNTTCTATGLGGTGTFTGSVTFVTAAWAAVANTGPGSLTISAAETTVTSPGGTVSPTSSTVAVGTATTSAAFSLTGGGGGWKATMTCSVTVNGVTYTVAVTGN